LEFERESFGIFSNDIDAACYAQYYEISDVFSGLHGNIVTKELTEASSADSTLATVSSSLNSSISFMVRLIGVEVVKGSSIT
jgi:hypothetical protein